MIVKTRKMSQIALGILILYNVLMIFYTIIPRYIVIAGSILFYIYFFSSAKKIYGVKWALVACTFASLPTSFTSVVGTSYGSFPLNWFTVFILLSFLFLLVVEKINVVYLLLLVLYLIFFVVSLLKVPNVYNAVTQGLTVWLLLLAFPIGFNLSKRCTVAILDDFKKIYLYGVIAFALQIAIQWIVLVSTGGVIGTYETMASRVAYAGLFGDYSFASLYLATGIILLFILFFEYKKIKLYQFILLEGLMLSSLIMTTARTGLYSLIIILALYICTRLKKLNWKVIVVLLVLMVAVPVFAEKFLELRGESNLLDGSGRIETYISALQVLKDNFWLGVGFGGSNWKEVTGLGIPHNFIIQYLAQFGIIGFSIFLAFFRKFVSVYFRYTHETKWMMGLAILGGMFIPDIASSRFFFAIVVMYMLEAGVERNMKEINYETG